MGKGCNNSFKKAIRHLKSTQIDEKLQMLSEIPANNTSGIYIKEPEYQVQDPDVQGLPRTADFTQDALPNGRDTTGLFLEDGTILTIEPPGDTSYILGPMASMWYAWGNFSTIGYIRQSDRRMVNLARIDGRLSNWNGSSGFTSYGQLTIDQAIWFKNTPKLNGADNDTPNYRAFYPGPPSNTPDEYGRYYCVITGTPKETYYTPPPRRIPPKLNGFDHNIPPGEANPNKNKRKKGYEVSELPPGMYWYDPTAPYKGPSGYKRPGSYDPKQFYDLGPGTLPSPNLPRTGPGLSRNLSSYQVADYKLDGKLLSENVKNILKNIKKPYALPEQPKIKYKITPKSSRVINPDLMKKAEVPSSFKKIEDRMWGKQERIQNSRASQEGKNEVLDHLGGGDHFWEYMTETSRGKNNKIVYDNFSKEKKEYKVVRKEELKGDTLLFIVDENGKKESILQSELSCRIADEFDKEVFQKYFQEQETLDADKDPLFKKVASKLKKEIDYSDKPSKKGYPNEAPPKTIDGWHPDLVNGSGASNKYNRLDPISANSMPSTGNPDIDAKVEAAKKIKIKEESMYNWRQDIDKSIKAYMKGKVIKEGMDTSGLFFVTLPPTSFDEDPNSPYDRTTHVNIDSYTEIQNGSNGNNGLVLDGMSNNSPGYPTLGYRFAALAPVDTSQFDSIIISIAGVPPIQNFTAEPGPNNLNNPPFSGSNQVVAYIEGGPSIVVQNGINYINIPPNMRGSKVTVEIFQWVDQSTSNSALFLTPYLARRYPLNVFVPLNSPEATSFIRTDPIMQGLSPKERMQKLKEMLDSGDEYVLKALGIDFPGTGVRPAETNMPPSWKIAQAVPPGPSGYKAPGTYDPKQFYNYSPPGVQPGQRPADKFIPSPNLPMTGPGLSQSNQGAEVANTFDTSKMEKKYGDVAGLNPLEIETLVDIVRKNAPTETTTNAYKTLQQNIKPGSRNHQIIKSLGINLGI